MREQPQPAQHTRIEPTLNNPTRNIQSFSHHQVESNDDYTDYNPRANQREAVRKVGFAQSMKITDSVAFLGQPSIQAGGSP